MADVEAAHLEPGNVLVGFDRTVASVETVADGAYVRVSCVDADPVMFRPNEHVTIT